MGNEVGNRPSVQPVLLQVPHREPGPGPLVFGIAQQDVDHPDWDRAEQVIALFGNKVFDFLAQRHHQFFIQQAFKGVKILALAQFSESFFRERYNCHRLFEKLGFMSPHEVRQAHAIRTSRGCSNKKNLGDNERMSSIDPVVSRENQKC